MICILLQDGLNLDERVLLCKLNRQVPLVEEHTAIDSLFGVPKFDVAIHGILAQTHRLELLTEALQYGRLLRKRVNNLSQRVEIFHLVVSDSKRFMIVRQLEILGSLCPPLSFRRVVAQVFVHLFQHLVIASTSFD